MGVNELVDLVEIRPRPVSSKNLLEERLIVKETHYVILLTRQPLWRFCLGVSGISVRSAREGVSTFNTSHSYIKENA